MANIDEIPYVPDRHGVSIVHIGIGAFHRAHQAVYTDDVLSKTGGDWRILGVSLQSRHIADALNAQDGVYSLVLRDQDGQPNIRKIGSISGVVAASRDTAPIIEAFSSPCTHIVSITVTEKAYGILRDKSGIDPQHPSIANDLANPEQPVGVIGMLAKGLKLRRDLGLRSFTVLCCDNLPDNGDMVRVGVLDFARRVDPMLGVWIAENTCFPNTMVDRITPATTPELIAEVSGILGQEDKTPVETEAFTQWVIEDNFCGPRPPWEDAGALLVDDVAPYENMKLRMLNGAHSMLAYLGYVQGCIYVRDVMRRKQLATLVDMHMQAAARTLDPLEEINFDDYRSQLIERFENPNIAHQTYQIAMDGTQKLPQRIFAPAVSCLDKGLSVDCFALATAAWMRYCLGQMPDGSKYELQDPKVTEIAEAVSSAGSSASKIYQNLSELSDFMPTKLADSNQFSERTIKFLNLLIVGKIEDITNLMSEI
ncbi:mannitol dehydrogenase family protein [Lentilitoribacter sp. EG35]|uniref:mannitol dehydrogenase family protein n=1 Tax=Lentilitoribacter sp. EG35 TaxID=3234192 RepID=UPI00345F32E4